MEHFGQTIIIWYKEYGRELPWRQTTDPYRIWISEVILQQTRVNQGYDYYQRFIARFPDVEALAKAEEDEVLKYCEGLGYYSRARNLHAAARSVNGCFPTTYEGVRALKGVGDYTAAAICSFAYGMPYAVVDGNVYRVLARYFGIDTPIDSTTGKKMFAELAQELLDCSRPAVYNQAIMDFGALQCTPQSPNCLFCPLSDGCLALARGQVSILPVKQNKTKTTDRYFNYFCVRTGDAIFLHKRTGDDIWKNLFQLPLIETAESFSLDALPALPQWQEWTKGSEQGCIRLVSEGVKHVLSHRVIYANFYELILPDGVEEFADFLKVGMGELERYALPRLVQQFMEKYVTTG